jgi:hypothetical protein
MQVLFGRQAKGQGPLRTAPRWPRQADGELRPPREWPPARPDCPALRSTATRTNAALSYWRHRLKRRRQGVQSTSQTHRSWRLDVLAFKKSPRSLPMTAGIGSDASRAKAVPHPQQRKSWVAGPSPVTAHPALLLEHLGGPVISDIVATTVPPPRYAKTLTPQSPPLAPAAPARGSCRTPSPQSSSWNYTYSPTACSA